MGNAPPHEDCWDKTTKDGRPGISVRDHCLNVGCVAEALLTFLPRQLKDLLPAGSAALAALHDIGKVSPGFQRKSEAWLVQRSLEARALNEGWSARVSDHAKISQFTVQELLGQSRLYPWAAVVWERTTVGSRACVFRWASRGNRNAAAWLPNSSVSLLRCRTGRLTKPRCGMWPG